jgi:hypothetical protein
VFTGCTPIECNNLLHGVELDILPGSSKDLNDLYQVNNCNHGMFLAKIYIWFMKRKK